MKESSRFNAVAAVVLLMLEASHGFQSHTLLCRSRNAANPQALLRSQASPDAEFKVHPQSAQELLALLEKRQEYGLPLCKEDIEEYTSVLDVLFRPVVKGTPLPPLGAPAGGAAAAKKKGTSVPAFLAQAQLMEAERTGMPASLEPLPDVVPADDEEDEGPKLVLPDSTPVAPAPAPAPAPLLGDDDEPPPFPMMDDGPRNPDGTRAAGSGPADGAGAEPDDSNVPEGAAAFDFGSTELYLKEEALAARGVPREGALVLTSYLKDMEWEYFGWLSGKRFVDLTQGCMGVAGVMAYKFGAEGVITDAAGELPLIREHVALNVGGDTVQIGETPEQAMQRVRTAAMALGGPLPAEVEEFKAAGPIDLIFLGDTILTPADRKASLASIQALAGPETLVLAAYPDRGGNEGEFKGQLEAAGFGVKFVFEDPARGMYLFEAQLAQ